MFPVIVFARARTVSRGARHRRIFGAAIRRWARSEMFVPFEDPNAKKTDYVSLFGAIAQILASTVAIIVVVTR